MVMAMKRSNYVTVGVSYIFVLLISGFVVSDVAKDRDECATQLVGLATCLPYVGGTAKAPTIDCCTGLKQVLQKSKKCLCVLVKDRNDPALGLNINATLALGLPSSCHAPANISECPALLHLAPNSPDAQVFEQFAKGSSTPAATGSGSSGSAASSSATTSDSSSAQVKSDGGRGKRWWWGVEMISGVLLWSLTSLLLISS